MSLGAVILAGGASRRMGSPKALLRIGGETFLDRMIGLFRKECSCVVAVLGHNADAILAAIQRAPEATITVNLDPERGQFSSLQCGIEALPAGIDAFFFCPMDYPMLRESTISALAVRYGRRAPGELVWSPVYLGRRGHPVLVSAALRGEFLDLPPEAQARDVTRRHAGATVAVEVDDPGILRDVDTPEDFRNLLERGP